MSATTRAFLLSLFIAIAVTVAWLLFVAMPRWYSTAAPLRSAGVTPPAATADAPARKIKAHLFYVSEDGTHLAGVEQDVPYAEDSLAQARELLNAQLAQPASPYISAVPAGTTLRALFLTTKGEAFVDLSKEVSSAHPGGSLNERLTIYTIVEAIAFNMPRISAVQILVDGKEVETLAGHVDLRRPLARNPQLTIER